MTARISIIMAPNMPARKPAIDPLKMPPAMSPATKPPMKRPIREPIPGKRIAIAIITKNPTKAPNQMLPKFFHHLY
jgi:hypothetical protein